MQKNLLSFLRAFENNMNVHYLFQCFVIICVVCDVIDFHHYFFFRRLLACFSETREIEIKNYSWSIHAWLTKQIQNIHLIKNVDWWIMLQNEMTTSNLIFAFKKMFSLFFFCNIQFNFQSWNNLNLKFLLCQWRTSSEMLITSNLTK